MNSNYWKVLETITPQYLKDHPNEIFVFGDNLLRRGKGGGAKLRDISNTYGFITKKKPDRYDSSYYRPEEYRPVFIREMWSLTRLIEVNPHHTFLISPIGSGLANKYHIWEKIIKEGLEVLRKYPNVKFLY